MSENPFLPDADNLARALVLAEETASKTKEDVVIVATLDRGEIGFNIHFAAGYALLREEGKAGHIAPICSVSKTGEISVYPVLKEFVDRMNQEYQYEVSLAAFRGKQPRG